MGGPTGVMKRRQVHQTHLHPQRKRRRFPAPADASLPKLGPVTVPACVHVWPIVLIMRTRGHYLKTMRALGI